MNQISLSEAQIEAATVELSRVLAITRDGVPVEMFSEAIDLVWHLLLKDRTSYIEFSLRACGQIIGHHEGDGFGTVRFIESYERRFGKLSPIWFARKDGSLDEVAHQRHHLVTAADELLGQLAAEEPGRPGDEIAAHAQIE